MYQSIENKSLVSVIIPTYSRPENLCRAIDSVLAQSYKNIEIIVVDDNGIGTKFQKETEKILKLYEEKESIIYIKHDVNRNGSAARNTGLWACNGEYVNFLDDDDVFEPYKIELQLKRLKMLPNVDACYCNSILIGKHRKIVTRNTKEGDLTIDLLTGKAFFNTSTILFKKQSLVDINGWDERFKRHQDWELMVRFFRNHSICIAQTDNPLLTKIDTFNTIYLNPEKSVEYRQFFLDELKGDIIASGHERQILRWQMEDLSMTMMSHGGKRLGRKFFLKIFKYGYPSFVAFIKYIYYIFIP